MLLCVLAFSIWGTGVGCPLELLLPETSPERRSLVNAELNQLENNPTEILKFIDKFGFQARFTFPGSIDGNQPVRIAIPISAENVGANNQGILYFTRDGQPRVMKVLGRMPNLSKLAGIRSGTHTMDVKDPDRLSLLQTARELEGSALGETQGAATIQRFGTFDFKGQTYYAIEMDELFPGQKRVTVKEGVRLDEVAFDPFSKKYGPTGEPVVKRMAEMYLKAIMDNVMTRDADFIVSQTGDVRWIDAAEWGPSHWRDPHMPEYERGSLGFAFSSFIGMVCEKSPEQARIFYDEFNRRLTQAQMTEGEKMRLRDELFNVSYQMKYNQAETFHRYRRLIGLEASPK